MEIGMDSRAFVGEKIKGNPDLDTDSSICLFLEISLSLHSGIWSDDDCWTLEIQNW